MSSYTSQGATKQSRSSTQQSRSSTQRSKGKSFNTERDKSLYKTDNVSEYSASASGKKSKLLINQGVSKTQWQPPEVTGTIREPRRGIYYASELLHHRDAQSHSKEFKDNEHVCIIRFPPDIASLLRQRLSAHQTDLETSFASSASINQLETTPEISASAELGLKITPTSKEDYRWFDITVEKRLGNPSSAIKLGGILLELPCFIEAYKSLESELLFKANDISQMIYVFYPNAGTATRRNPLDLKSIKENQLWEWQDGLTPGTHRIRQRRFKNFNVFEKTDVAAAEKEICNTINQKKNLYEVPILEASTEFSMEEHFQILKNKTSSNEVVAIIGPENPILYAAIHQVSPSAIESDFEKLIENEKSALLRNQQIKHGESLRLITLEEKLRFSSNPDIKLDPDNIIPDDISDIIFGDSTSVISDLSETMTQFERQQLESSTLSASAAPLSSSETSLSSEEDIQARKERRQKKRK